MGFPCLALLSAVGCAADDSATTTTEQGAVADATTTTEATTTTVATTTTEERAPTEAEAGAEASTAVMPNVMCQNLQDAQDEIQRAGVFFSRSDDASGQGRSQVLDSNWIVVGQQPAPGSVVGEAEAVLSVVKIGEPSPC